MTAAASQTTVIPPSSPRTDKCVTVIFNPVSGQGDPDARLKVIQEALAQHGYRCQELVTTPEQGARYQAEQALRNGVDLLAVSGGDGTVMEAMAALVGTGVPIAIFPAGTGNLLSINLGLPRQVPDAVHAALFGDRRPLDLARIETPDAPKDSPEYFAIIAGAGYDAWIIHDADRETKNRLGLGAYLWAAVKNLHHRPVRATVRLDDGTTLRRRARSVMVANMGRLQGDVEMVPDARPDDGTLDVAILEAENLSDWFRLLKNALLRRLRDDPAVEFHRARHVEVTLSEPQPMQFDGESTKEQHRSFQVEIVPAAVEVMVPKASPV